MDVMLKEIGTWFLEKPKYRELIVTKMKTMGKAASVTDKEDKGKETLDADLWGQLDADLWGQLDADLWGQLDADLWGQLQEYIPLQCIYEKLSQRDLFPLRLVSKEWNHAALQWILPTSSFVNIDGGLCRGELPFVSGIVTYNSAFDNVKFNGQCLRLLDVKTYVPPFEVEGLILCHNPNDLEERGVYNVHTRTWHTIPVGPKQSKTKNDRDWSKTLSAYGLVVDTSVKPYTFKLIEGNRHFKTQIYDSKSKSWSRTPSQLPSSYEECLCNNIRYSCICHNNNIFIPLGMNTIVTYSLEDDRWASLKFPVLRSLQNDPRFDESLGVWAGRILTTAENIAEQTVVVWELVDSEAHEWVEYARLPVEQYYWLWNLDHAHEQLYCLRSFFNDGYLLICSWQWDDARVLPKVRFLFNLATKVWQQVDLPM